MMCQVPKALMPTVGCQSEGVEESNNKHVLEQLVV